MGEFKADILVAVYPFTRQPEGEEVVIGRSDTSVFLVLPSDAVELLDYLAEGKTVGEAQSIYQNKYGEIPDIEELLNLLEIKGFVQPLLKDKADHFNTFIKTSSIKHFSAKATPLRFHFTNFPQSLAQRLFSKPVLLSCGVLIALALIAIAVDSSIIPGWNAFFFHENFTLMRLVLSLMNFVVLFLHEMAHLIAARAVGVSSRLGIGNRMWFLVAETDMTGVWSVPRNQRYLPFLAGSLLDMVCASVLTLVFFAHHHGWIALSSVVVQLGQALLLIYLLGLLWQCYLFVRTDFYYVLANFFRCKSLMKDTEVFLYNKMTQFIRRLRKVDQSHIPKAERRVIRSYAILYLLGRIAALVSFILITIPLIWHYSLTLFAVLSAGYSANPYAFIDALLMILLVIAPQCLGFWLWIRSFCVAKR